MKKNPSTGPDRATANLFVAPVLVESDTPAFETIIPASRSLDISGDASVPTHELALSLAVAKASGIDWFGYGTTAGHVLFVTTDRSPANIDRQLQTEAKRRGIDRSVCEAVRVVGSIHRSAEDLVVETARAILRFPGGKPDLVIVDAAKNPADRLKRVTHLCALAELAPRFRIPLVVVCPSNDNLCAESTFAFDTSARCIPVKGEAGRFNLVLFGTGIGTGSLMRISVLRRGKNGLEQVVADA